MKVHICFVSAVLALSWSLAAQTPKSEVPVPYDPMMTLADEPDPAQASAINYNLLNGDDQTFIKAFAPEDQKQGSVDDEFASDVGKNAGGDDVTNQEAIVYARQFLGGEIDFPVQFRLKLRRYNPANSSYITDATVPCLILGVELKARGEMPRTWRRAHLTALRIRGYDSLSSLRLPVEQAKRLSEILGDEREIVVLANCRLVPKTCRKSGYEEYQCDATMQSVKVGATNSEGFPADIVSAVKFGVYARTAAEKDFEVKMLYRAMVSENDTLIFLKDGKVLTCSSLNSTSSAEQKVRLVANGRIGEWYLMGGRILLNGGIYTDTVKPYEVEGKVLRIGGIPYAEESRLKFDGSNVVWRP